MNKKLVAMLSALSLCVTVTACSKNEDNTKLQSNTNKTSINIESLENESVSDPDTYIKLGTETTIEGQGAEVSNNKVAITKAGTYTLTVVFDRQMYNGKEWENTGEQDTKQVNFNITQAQIVTATPTPQPNGATAKSAVKTGDTTNIAPFVIILVIAAGCIAGVVVYKKKKK